MNLIEYVVNFIAGLMISLNPLELVSGSMPSNLVVKYIRINQLIDYPILIIFLYWSAIRPDRKLSIRIIF